MNKKVWLLLPLSFLMSFAVFGQEKEKVKEKKKSATEAVDSTIVLSKGRIVIKDRIYRQNAPFITFGYGAGFGFESKQVEQNMAFSYHHFINKIGLQIGYLSSSDTKTWWNSDQKLKELSLGVGKRWESTRYNISVFGGPSWASGSYLWTYVADSMSQPQLRVHYFSSLGVHAEVLATYKLSYDIGVGLSLVGCMNKQYSVAGAQIHLFFSTAFVRNYN